MHIPIFLVFALLCCGRNNFKKGSFALTHHIKGIPAYYRRRESRGGSVHSSSLGQWLFTVKEAHGGSVHMATTQEAETAGENQGQVQLSKTPNDLLNPG